MELLSLFIPQRHDTSRRPLRRETLDVLATWQRGSRHAEYKSSLDSDTVIEGLSSTTSGRSIPTLVASCCSHQDLSNKTDSESPLSMSALEHALRWNPEPLQHFASFKDFTGENISFLVYLAEWKQNWKLQRHQTFSLPSEYSYKRARHHRQQFNRAIRIYAAFVSMRHAEFPVNLPARHRTAMDEVFERPTTVLYGGMDYNSQCYTPGRQDKHKKRMYNKFEESGEGQEEEDDDRKKGTYNHSTSVSVLRDNSAMTAYPYDRVAPFAFSPTPSTNNVSTKRITQILTAELDRSDSDCSVWYWGNIPSTFTPTVFDEAEREIRFLVWTNTWPKFVSHGTGGNAACGHGGASSSENATSDKGAYCGGLRDINSHTGGKIWCSGCRQSNSEEAKPRRRRVIEKVKKRVKGQWLKAQQLKTCTDPAE